MNYIKEIKTRVIWLSIGLILSLGIAQIIKQFETTLQTNLVLASFIPLVVYMSDAVGTQMESIIIRELSGKKKFPIVKFIKQQSVIVTAVAIIIGIMATITVSIIDQSTDLGLIVGISLFCGIMSSLITGSVLPYIFWMSHNDPAAASGPVATVIQDMFSVLIFLYVAQTIL